MALNVLGKLGKDTDPVAAALRDFHQSALVSMEVPVLRNAMVSTTVK